MRHEASHSPASPARNCRFDEATHVEEPERTLHVENRESARDCQIGDGARSGTERIEGTLFTGAQLG
jgi:hypothetical protein